MNFNWTFTSKLNIEYINDFCNSTLILYEAYEVLKSIFVFLYHRHNDISNKIDVPKWHRYYYLLL